MDGKELEQNITSKVRVQVRAPEHFVLQKNNGPLKN